MIELVTRRNREPETATIDAVTHDGRGIVSTLGKKVFVSGALPGEEVRFVRRKRRRNFDEAELCDIVAASPDRVDARCAAYGRCGGCSLQHVSSEQQRLIKSQAVRESLQRIGRVEPETWLQPLFGDEWHYRRRARLAVKDVPGKGRVLVGFREKFAPYIADMDRCEVIARPLDSLIEPLSRLIEALSIRARLPQIEVAIAENAVALVFRVLDAPSDADRQKLRNFAQQHALRIWLQPGGPNTLQVLWPEKTVEALCYTLPEFDVEIAFEPVDFVQVNADVNRRMVSAAVLALEPGPDARVLDLYCGIGNFSLPLARHAGRVLGIEGDPSLVARASANADRNGLHNARFQCADLSAVRGDESWLQEHWDGVLLDPARTGAAEVIRHMRSIDPARIVYVSCHPGSLARDAGTLVNELGYRFSAAGIIDMFPHTGHVESIAVFIR